MRNFFSISRKQVTILVTLIILASASLWYYLVYIPNNEQSLNEQHFRWLQKTDENIRTKITTNDTLLANLLEVYDTSKNSARVEDYISNYSVTDASLAYKKEKDSTVKSFKQPEISQRDTASVQFILRWDSGLNKVILSASKKKQDTIFTVLMKYDFENFIKPLLIQGLFDHYVVFYEGTYIYEDFHSGLGYESKDEDSLLKTGKAMTGANIVKQKVGGVDYDIFFQPINFSGKRLIVSGLLSQKKMDAEKKQLPAGVAILAITIALGLLLFLPWIKIYFQGKYDKVSLTDAAESVVVAKLLISLIILLFFTYNYSFRRDAADSKEVLAKTIDTAFTQEIYSAYNCLKTFDSIMYRDSMFYDIKNLGKGNIQSTHEENILDQAAYENSSENTKLKFLNNIGTGLQYYRVNWLDSNGRLKYGWITSDQNDIHANYRDRDYFKNIINHNTITLNIAQNDPIYIDQVISRTANAFRTTLSKRSLLDTLKNKQDSARVVQLSFTMQSLQNVIMPAGYSFAIIDNKGEVKYHSRSERNLNENLLEEFSSTEALNDALEGGFKETFKTQYYEGTDSVLVTPLKGFPYFIVIMEDLSFPATVQVETFSFTWGMVLVFLLVVILDLFVLISASSRRSLFKRQYFVTSWLWPRANSRTEYLFAAIGNCILVIALIFLLNCCSHCFDYLSYLFLLLFSIPLSTIFINSLFLNKYRASKNKTYQNYKVRCNIYSVSFLIIINIVACILLGDSAYWHTLIFQAIMVLIGFLLFYFHKPTGHSNNNISYSEKGYINYFTFMIFTRLLITSAIPVVFFYTSSFNFENNLVDRYRQYDLVRQLQQKFPGELMPDRPKYSTAIYIDSAWIDTLSLVRDSGLCMCNADSNKLTQNQENTGSLYNAFGFYIDDVSNINNDNFFHSSTDDGYLCFNNFFDSVLYTSTGNKLCVDRKPYSRPEQIDTATNLEISSQNLNYSFPGVMTQNGFIFWLLLAAAMFVFCLLIREVIIKVCSLNRKKIPLSNEESKTILPLLNSQGQSLIWINGLLTDEVKETVEAEINHSNPIPCLDFDEIKIDDNKPRDVSIEQLGENNFLLHLKLPAEKKSIWNDTKSKVINDPSSYAILLHVESNLDNEKIAAEKLDCLKDLFAKGKKVIIISTIHPQRLNEINKLENETKINAATVRLIDMLLNNSTVITLPLIENNFEDKKDNQNAKANPVMHMFLDKETKYTLFLKNLRNSLSLQGIPSEISEDQFTLRIQSLANNFYISIWHSLSSDEKFVLFDYAADGLVNITNTFAVGLLINKGLIIEEEGHLRIF